MTFSTLAYSARTAVRTARPMARLASSPLAAVGRTTAPTRALSQTAVARAKGDTSTIEFYKMPAMGPAPVREPVAEIPVLYGPSPRSQMADVISVPKPEIVQLSGAPVAQAIQDTIDNSSMVEADAAEFSFRDSSELTSRDRRALGSIVAGVVGWWAVGNVAARLAHD
ncbi:uncharacterized protein V1510DRAFT_422557 [Dipodascopsis tothii]|uniref:uncharacterized protein n=1 Tax=Dipodascopsis tothii TaxID=44089 RepID=UPI0034CD66EC